jgi:hypothetical protein
MALALSAEDQRTEVVVVLAEQIANAYPADGEAAYEALDLAEALLLQVANQLRWRGTSADAPVVFHLDLAGAALRAFTRPSSELRAYRDDEAHDEVTPS